MAQANVGDTVKIHFTCTLEDGIIFDSSSGKDPLVFTIGQSQVLKGLEQAVIGMRQGETKKITIKAEEVFGPYLQEKVNTVSRDQFPAELEPVVGMKFEIKQKDGSTNTINVTDVTESTVTLDANHHLAGKVLNFEIELIEIQPSKYALFKEHFNKAVTLQDKGLLDEALSLYKKAIEMNPYAAEAYFNIGVIYQEKGLSDKAALNYEIAIGLNKDFLEAHHNLGVVFKEKGIFHEAVPCFQRVLQLKPDHASALYNLGNTLVAEGRFKEAMIAYEKAIDIQPSYADAHWSMALMHLLFGNYEEGWRGYEYRWELKDVMERRVFSQAQWNGSNMNNLRILLYTEQGFGDTLQFIRYAPLVAQKGGEVILECQKELMSLLKNVEGIQHIVLSGQPLPEFDLHCPLLSLPLMFGTTLETIPATIPYLKTDPGLVQQWKQKIITDNSHLKIGLVWAGDPRYKFGQDRSCSLTTFASLAQFNNIIFYSLQKGDSANQLKNPPEGMTILDFTAEIRDFSDTAAIIENLDLIISVDTAVAHLAGALGKPIWSLLPFIPDWRWMLNREDSPWYPTMRLFRQPSRGDWASVINFINDELKKFFFC